MREKKADSLQAGRARHLSPLLQAALVLGLLVHALGFLIIRIASDPLPAREENPAFITLVSTEGQEDAAELVEQASLFDSAPLFIPGEWSSAAQVFSARTERDWRSFPSFEPELELKDEIRLSRLSLAQRSDLERPSDLLNWRFWDLFAAFGEKESSVEAFESAGSIASVTILSGNAVYPPEYNLRMAVDLPVDEAFFAAQPLVLTLNLSAPGLPMGAPLVEQSSGSEALDARLLEWLRRPATLAQLPAGFLELRVYP
ncbi:MAG: hypothetical protein ACNA77_01620 [Opitutales bacterium]